MKFVCCLLQLLVCEHPAFDRLNLWRRNLALDHSILRLPPPAAKHYNEEGEEDDTEGDYTHQNVQDDRVLLNPGRAGSKIKFSHVLALTQRTHVRQQSTTPILKETVMFPARIFYVGTISDGNSVIEVIVRAINVTDIRKAIEKLCSNFS